MEPEVVKFVAELDPAVFVLDCLPNMARNWSRSAQRGA
jgi:GDSL-like Lipase/Acylhydrolase family